MPKKLEEVYEEDSETEGDEYDESAEFDEQEGEEEIEKKPRGRPKATLPNLPYHPRTQTDEIFNKNVTDKPGMYGKKPQPKQVAQRAERSEPTKRYSYFVQQPIEGIQDEESKEIVAVNIWQALADIIERLERIENSIGNMIEN